MPQKQKLLRLEIVDATEAAFEILPLSGHVTIMRITATVTATVALLFSLPLFSGCSTVTGLPSGGSQNIGHISVTHLDDALKLARTLRQQGRTEEAATQLKALVLVRPDDVTALGEYGKALATLGQGREAVAFLSRAALITPNDWTIYSALGVAYDTSGETAKAKLMYEHALQLAPGNVTVLNNYALSRAMAGDEAGAKKLIAEAAARGAGGKKVAGNKILIDRLARNNTPTLPTAATAHTTVQTAQTTPTTRTAQVTPLYLRYSFQPHSSGLPLPRK